VILVLQLADSLQMRIRPRSKLAPPNSEIAHRQDTVIPVTVIVNCNGQPYWIFARSLALQ